MRTLVAYVPVLHEGYIRFFNKHKGPKELYILGPSFLTSNRIFVKDIRQLKPELMKEAIESLRIFEKGKVKVLERKNTFELKGKKIIAPDEKEMREILGIFSHTKVTYEPFFLRWDKENSVAEKRVKPHRNAVMRKLFVEAQKSPDMWRQIGAAIYKGKKLLLMGHNRHLPSNFATYIHGDPRNNFHKGDHIEISSAFHAEASLIAEAARRGIKLEDTSMYVTTFPCPPCAKLIAHSGIKTLYYAGGYSVLDGEEILKGVGVRLVHVK